MERREADDPVGVDPSREAKTADRLARDSWPSPRVELVGDEVFLDGRALGLRGVEWAEEIASALGVPLGRR